MKARSAEELYDALSSDLAWRKKELTVFHSSIDRADQRVRPALLRASVALLYAHWEGYVRTAATCYLQYLSRLRLSISQLRPELAALVLRRHLSEFIQTNRPALHASLVQTIRDKANEIARIPTSKDAIRTGANLNFRQLQDVLTSIGCDCTRYEEYADLIDEQLLGTRNRVVHGEGDYIRLPEWDELRSSIVWLMDDITTQILNSAVEKSYLAARQIGPSGLQRVVAP